LVHFVQQQELHHEKGDLPTTVLTDGYRSLFAYEGKWRNNDVFSAMAWHFFVGVYWGGIYVLGMHEMVLSLKGMYTTNPHFPFFVESDITDDLGFQWDSATYENLPIWVTGRMVVLNATTFQSTEVWADVVHGPV